MTSRLALAATVAAAALCTTAISASAQTYEVTKLVPGSAFHGVHGLGIDKTGRLFAGSVAGAAGQQSLSLRYDLKDPKPSARRHMSGLWRGA